VAGIAGQQDQGRWGVLMYPRGFRGLAGFPGGEKYKRAAHSSSLDSGIPTGRREERVVAPAPQYARYFCQYVGYSIYQASKSDICGAWCVLVCGRVQVYPKIESADSVKALDEILDASDGAMVSHITLKSVTVTVSSWIHCTAL
jgi:hypothetical protein